MGQMICLEQIWNKLSFSKSKFTDCLFLLCLLVTVLVWSIMIYNKAVVMSEGWYTVYSDLVLSGKMPYRDFEFAFPPFYLYLITTVRLVFGSELIVMRLFGIFIYVSVAVVTFIVLKQLFPSWIAFIASLALIFVVQSENTYIMYDYTRVYDLLNVVSLYFLLSFTRDVMKGVNIRYFYLLIAGIVLSLSFLTRQSSGLIVIFAVFLYLSGLLICKREIINYKLLLYYFIGLLIPLGVVLIYLISIDSLGIFIQMVYLSGDKGSISSMLFGWIPGLIKSITPMIAIATLLSVVLILDHLDDSAHEENNLVKTILVLVISSIIIIICVSLYNNVDLSWKVLAYFTDYLVLFFLIDFVLLLAFLIGFIKSIKNGAVNNTYLPLLLISIYIIAICYGSGTSAGLSYGQSGLNYAFVIGLLLYSITKNKRWVVKYVGKYVVIAIVIILISTSVAIKVVQPYSWWGIQESPYNTCVYTTEIPYFNGVYLTETEKNSYEDILWKAEYILDDGDEIYCYSQIPIFYTLIGCKPTVKAPVCWFDVCRDQTVAEDLVYLKSHLPKLIMFADHGEYALDAHEAAFSQEGYTGHRDMYQWLLDCKDGVNGDYVVWGTYRLNDYPLYLMIKV